MDVRMPGLDGIEATRRLVAAGGTAKVVMLTTFHRDEYVYATGVDEAPYLALARLALVEAAWLAEDPEQARAQLARLRSRLTSLEVKPLAAVIAWEHRLGVVSGDVPAVAPYAAQVAGPPHRAAQVWDEMGLPYHAAPTPTMRPTCGRRCTGSTR
jgi:hypothetical protein